MKKKKGKYANWKPSHRHDKKNIVILRMDTKFGYWFRLAEVCSVCNKIMWIYNEVPDGNRYLTSEEILEKYKDRPIYYHDHWAKIILGGQEIKRENINKPYVPKNKLPKRGMSSE